MDRARRALAAALEERGWVRVRCRACGETIGSYQPGVVSRASTEAPRLRMKCFRPGCRAETLVTLEEMTLASTS